MLERRAQQPGLLSLDREVVDERDDRPEQPLARPFGHRARGQADDRPGL